MDDLGLCRVGTRPEGGDRAFFLRYVGRKVKVNADKSKVMVLGGNEYKTTRREGVVENWVEVSL